MLKKKKKPQVSILREVGGETQGAFEWSEQHAAGEG